MRIRRLTTTSSALVLIAGAALLAVSALLAVGFPVDHVKLHDGGIWVTSNTDDMFGRLNKPAGQIDAAFYPPGGAQSTSQLDIVQEDSAVAAWDRNSGNLYPVDVSRGTISADNALPIGGTDDVQMAGGTLAVLDPASGAVWAQRIDPNASLSALNSIDPTAKHLAIVGTKAGAAGAALAVGEDGTVYAVSAAGRIATIEPSPSGTGFSAPVYSQLGHGVSSVVATAVGDRLVVVDPTNGTVVVPGGPSATLGVSTGRTTPTATVVPQLPGPAANDVVLATPTALVAMDLSSGDLRVLTTSRHGTPAAPVRLDNCVHAAWGGPSGGYVRACGGGLAQPVPLAGSTPLVQPSFRVNRDSIVLNDLATGAVWDLTNQRRVDDWLTVRPPPVDVNKGNKNDANQAQNGHTLPPKAVDDTLGARPGRTTLLHVLDNDSDPSGAILAVSGITAPDNARVHLSIAPDGQTIAASIPASSETVHFKYTVSDGKLTATASVTVQIRGTSDNKAPNLYPGYHARTFTVPAGGHLSIPVVADWRDFDGDPIGLASATVKAGSVATTPDGSLDYTAPGRGGTQTISYAVTDGIAGPVGGKVTIQVQSPTSTAAVAAVTNPDVARGQAGSPITIRPLDNDLPGADPTDPAAQLALAGDLASPAGTTVTTDLQAGTVVLTAARPGVFKLAYKAAYGDAPFAAGAIRVDVVPAPDSAEPPVAMPDTAILHGQQPATVDVLDNDFDPSGGVLVVEHAVVAGDSNLQVAIVAGHWLRINATNGTTAPTPQIVQYTISDGTTSPVTGEVSVTELDASASTAPVTTDDYATVRAGDEVTVPVLDNDTNPAGAPMTLLPDVSGAPGPGRLVVAGETGSPAAGSAYVNGNAVRFVAPATVPAERHEAVSYVVTDTAGDRTDGTLHLTIEPLPGPTDPDRPPLPAPIDARAVAGQTITVQIPTTGVDPDGDAVTVAGMTGSPALGRIVRFNATSLTYQAYPTSAGTDEFDYVVTDRYGQQAHATIRVGVVAPDIPQPPVAVDDDVTAAPGAHVHVNVLANDLVAAGDVVTVQPLSAADASLAGYLKETKASLAQGFIDATAPPATGVPLVVHYRISDGVNQPSEATLTIRSSDGADIPPLVADAYPSVHAATKSVSVNVGKYAQDPDSPTADVKVDKVFDDRATNTGTTVTIPAGTSPRTVAYEVVDSGGATAIGIIHVPAFGAGDPYVQPGAMIQVPRNGSRTIDLSSVISDPGGKPVRLTTTDQISASPQDHLKVTNQGDTKLVLTASGDYLGPGAVSIEITDGATLTDPNAHTVSLNIPVQIGTAVPVLRCPDQPLTLIEGGNTVTVDVTSVCHVWAADPATLGALQYSATWTKPPSGVQLGGSGTHRLEISADSEAVPGTTGTLTIKVVGTDAVAATLPVVVRAARPPSVSDVRRTTNAGRTVTLDMRSLVTSELRAPVISAIDITQTSGQAATFRKNGAVVSITPDAKSHGTMTFDVSVTDVADLKRDDRVVHARITLNVLGVPDAPAAPAVGRTTLSKSVQLSWASPANNGAPIDRFDVSSAGGDQTCAASPCLIKGLTNGVTYHFKVRAHNVVGWSQWSPLSAGAMPNSVPGAVTNLTTSTPLDHSLQIAWGDPPNEGTPVTSYDVTWSGGGQKTVTGNGFTATGLDNDTVYTFRVVAVNADGPGPAASATGQSGGAPARPPAPTISSTNSADSSTKAVTVSWPAIDPNGPGPTTYTLVRTGGGTKTVCSDVTATRCDDDGIANNGTVYSYSLTAANADAPAAPGSHTSAQGPGAQLEASDTPSPITGVSAKATGSDGQATLTFDAPASHGKSSTVTCTAGGNSCGTWTFPTGGQSNVTETINGLSNGTSTTISLKDCNGSQGLAGSGSACDSAATTTVTTYGPLKSPKVTASASGTTVSFTVSVNPNGAAATVKLQTSKQSQTFTTGTGSWSYSGSDSMGYSATDTISITVTASGRSSVSASGSAKTGPPPATVTVSKGKSCNGSSCGGTGSCTNSSCGFIHLQTTNFSGSFSCHFSSNYTGGDTWATENFSSNTNADTRAYFGAPNYTLNVTCSNSSQSASDSMTWY